MPRLNPRTAVLVVGSGVNPWSETVSYCGAQNRQLPGGRDDRVARPSARMADDDGAVSPRSLGRGRGPTRPRRHSAHARISPQATDRLDACAEVRAVGMQIDGVL